MNNVNYIDSTNSIQSVSSVNFKKKKAAAITDKTPQAKLNRIYRSQGLIGKLYDAIKGSLGAEYSRTNLQEEIKSGRVRDIDTKLNKYYDRQKNATEMTLDLATGITAGLSFQAAKILQEFIKPYVKNAAFNKGATLFGLGISAITGMILKPVLKGINGIGTPRQERKKERSILKDMATGLIDGAAAPIAYVHKLGVLGAAGVNSLSRYIFNRKANKDNSLGDHITSNWLLKLPLLGIASVWALKHHNYISKVQNAIVKSRANVKDIKVHDSKLPLTELADLTKYNMQDKTNQRNLLNATRRGFFSKTYLTLTRPFKFLRRSRIFGMIEIGAKPAVKTLFNAEEILTEKEMMGVMREIEKYNIFYPKMLQAMPSNIANILEASGAEEWASKITKDGKPLGRFEKLVQTVNDFLNNYKSSCPSSRTVEEAQKHIEKTFGKKYTIKGDEPLGVGTIAESYLAKDNETGQEVVIKMIKQWVSKEKMDSDRARMLEIIERSKNKMKPDEYSYQKKLVEELYNAWSKEIDLNLEAEAAELLGRHAVHYNTVAPVTVKDNIFVMEKANGVQFDKFAEYLKKNNIKLTKDEAVALSINYFKVFFEQLLSVPKKGQKVFHADPHAGNIFIDIKNKEKPFTFIDTGNVMRFSPEEAIQNVTSHLDYFIGNSKNIAKRLVKGATLPDGMTEETAADMLAEHLDDIFFSGKYKIGNSDPFSAINNEAMDFMKSKKVILNHNNTNLVKAELTYLINMLSLKGIEKQIDSTSSLDREKASKNFEMMARQIGESIKNGVINNPKCTVSEVYDRLKYIAKNPEQFFTSLFSYYEPPV